MELAQGLAAVMCCHQFPASASTARTPRGDGQRQRALAFIGRSTVEDSPGRRTALTREVRENDGNVNSQLGVGYKAPRQALQPYHVGTIRRTTVHCVPRTPTPPLPLRRHRTMSRGMRVAMTANLGRQYAHPTFTVNRQAVIKVSRAMEHVVASLRHCAQI